MSDPNLSKEEKQILKDFEAGEFKSILTPKRKKMLQAAAEETFKKDKRINIRISSRDLESLQRRALEEGIPYQTLVSSVLHKYVSGGLHDIMANKALNTDAKKTSRRLAITLGEEVANPINVSIGVQEMRYSVNLRNTE